MTIIDLLNADGFQTRHKSKGEHYSSCPFCGGKDRFCVWPDESDGKGRYWCRQCEAKGDAITYLVEHRKLSIQEAKKLIGMPADQPKTKPKHKKSNKKTFEVITPVPDDAPTPTAD